MFFKRLLTVLSLTLIQGLSVFGLVLVAQAAGPWYVSPFGNDSDDCLSTITACQTIMAAMGKATPGDTIMIAAGTYPESLVITKNLTLQGEAADLTIVSAFGGSVASITTTAKVTIADLTLMNGSAVQGGGIDNQGVLTLSHSIVVSNTAISDGGVPVSEFKGGGGIFNNGTLRLISSTIYNNQVNTFSDPLIRGGAIYNEGGTITLENSSVVSNGLASFLIGGMGIRAEGGGIYNVSGTITLNNSTIRDNKIAEGSDVIGTGGGIVNINGDVILNNSTLNGNKATSGCGGIVNHSMEGTSLLRLTNSTVSGNTAADAGGGICNVSYENASSSLATVLNSTISNNVADTIGGISNSASGGGSVTLILTNTILANNTYPNCSGGMMGAITTESGGHNLLGASECMLAGATDIIDTDPLLGPLQDNGGSTFTHALLAGSPAIDAGDCILATDQRREPRPDGGNTLCDIGAVERHVETVDLTLTKAVTPTVVVPGNLVSYTITIDNNGPGNVTNAIISDTLSDDLTFVGPVTLEPGGITLPQPPLPILATGLAITDGETISLTFPVMVASDLVAGTELLSKAGINRSEVNLPDTDTVAITVASVPALTLTKTVDVNSATVGDTITYTYRVTNTGNTNLTNLIASDSPLGPVPLDQTSLAPDESTIGLLTYTIVEADLPGPLTNTVVVTSASPTGELTATAEAEVSLTFSAALTLSHTANVEMAQVGDTITYTYRVTNTGNVQLTNLVAQDTPLGAVSLSQTSLAPGQGSSGTLTYTIEAADLPGPFISTVIATATTSLGDEVVTMASRSVSLLSADSSDLHLYLPLILKNN